MTPRHDDARATPSILDRIIDSGPAGEIGETATGSVEGMKRSLFRDLTALLNTKRGYAEIPEEFEEAASSLLTYGLPDFTSYGRGDAEDLRETIVKAIQTFEPRLTRVSVVYEKPEKAGDSLIFHVKALLRIEPLPVPIEFDTMLHRESKRIEITGEEA